MSGNYILMMPKGEAPNPPRCRGGRRGTQASVAYLASCGSLLSTARVLEVLVGDSGEMRAVFRRHTEDHGIGGQGFALALGHVFGELVHHAVHGEPGFAAIGECGLGRAAVGARGHAEGCVAGGAVGGGSQEVGRRAALALEQQVAPAAVRAAWRFGHGVDRDSGEQSTQKNPFHSVVLFLK